MATGRILSRTQELTRRQQTVEQQIDDGFEMNLEGLDEFKFDGSLLPSEEFTI